MEEPKLIVYEDGKYFFEIIGIKDVLKWTPSEEENNFFGSSVKNVDIIVFETSTGIEFVKICTDHNFIGVRAESVWVYHTDPEFEKMQQSLIGNIKINDMNIMCDLIKYSNNETGEEKEIYFDITDFFGKSNETKEEIKNIGIVNKTKSVKKNKKRLTEEEIQEFHCLLAKRVSNIWSTETIENMVERVRKMTPKEQHSILESERQRKS